MPLVSISFLDRSFIKTPSLSIINWFELSIVLIKFNPLLIIFIVLSLVSVLWIDNTEGVPIFETKKFWAIISIPASVQKTPLYPDCITGVGHWAGALANVIL